MKAYNVLFLLVTLFLVLLPFSIAVVYDNIPSGSGSCCVPRDSFDILFEEFGASYPTGNINSQADCGGALFVDACYSNGNIIDSRLENEGCCCRVLSGAPWDAIRTEQILEYTCDVFESEDTDGFNFVFDEGARQCASSCLSTTPTYDVSGIVVRSSDNTPLEGLVVNYEGISTTTDANGEFTFQDVLEGTRYFTAYGKFNMDIDGEFYDCEDEGQNFDSSSGQNLRFELLCTRSEIQVEVCEPSWYFYDDNDVKKNLADFPLDGWGACQNFLGDYLKTRKLYADNCPTDNPTQQTTTEYSAEGCDEVDPEGACKNNALDPGEGCDRVDDFWEYKIGNTFVSGDLPCSHSAIYGPGYSYDVTCTPDCTLDLSACQDPCLDCDNIDNCNNECALECDGKGACVVCEEALTFAPEGFSGTDLFSLYDNLRNDGETHLAVRYHEGTKDVTLSWSYAEDCEGNVFGFDVLACAEGLQTGECDPSETNVYSSTDANLREHTFVNVLEPGFFCYEVTARTSEGSYPSERICLKTGDLMCMTPHEGKNCVETQVGSGIYAPAGCKVYTEDNSLTNNIIDMPFTCEADETCIETAFIQNSPDRYEQGAACVDRENCDSCNGLFGLFASYNLQYSQAWTCEELIFDVTEDGIDIPGFSGNHHLAQCYEDRTETMFDAYKSCEDVTSCYDYKSPDACGNDPCFKFTTVDDDGNGLIDSGEYTLGCAWNTYYDGNEDPGLETGLGICQPVDAQSQDCSVCDTNSPLGFCTAEICQMYGDCYQRTNEIDDSLSDAIPESLQDSQARAEPLPACLNRGDLSCALYETEDDCTGGSGNVPDVDVYYVLQANEDDERYVDFGRARVFGTNEQTAWSDDDLDYGDCRWDADKNICFKDSNDYLSPTDGSTFRLTYDDCEQDNSDVACYTDAEPPTTHFYIDDAKAVAEGYGLGELLELQYYTVDDRNPESVTTYVSFLRRECIETHGCVQADHDITSYGGNAMTAYDENTILNTCIPNDCYLYPQHTLEEFVNDQDIRDAMFGGVEGRIEGVFLYFSEDRARNLEIIQAKEMIVDNSKPQITITSTITPKEISDNYYASDLSFTIQVDEVAICSAHLEDAVGTTISPSQYFSIDQADGTQDVKYYDLADGEYIFEVFCKDELQTPNTVNEHVTLNADATIQPIQPDPPAFTKSELENGAFDIQIVTGNPGTCRFAFDTTIYSEMSDDFEFDAPTSVPSTNYPDTYAADPDGTVYEYTYAYDTSEMPISTGVYFMYFACEFTTRTVQGKTGDLIVFGVDEEAPTLELTEDGGEFKDEWRDLRNIEIGCTDATEESIEQYTKGCAELEVCLTVQDINDLTPSGFVCPQSTEIITEFPYSMRLKQENHAFTKLYYRAQDKGGAIGQWNKVNLKVRDNEISEPFITIQ